MLDHKSCLGHEKGFSGCLFVLKGLWVKLKFSYVMVQSVLCGESGKSLMLDPLHGGCV